MQIKVDKITLLRLTHGTDRLSFTLDKPSGIWPFTGTATLSMEVARGTGEDYLKTNFYAAEYQFIDAEAGTTSTKRAR